MSLLQTLHRLFHGKPVFQNQEQPVSPQQNAPAENQAAGPKIIPQVRFGRVECRQNGAYFQCDCWITNASTVQLDLDRLQLFGVVRDLGTFVSPGEERRFTLYNGKPLQTNTDTRCVLKYKDPTGDWFQAEFWVEYKQEPDGTYSVIKFRPMPTQDI